MLYNVFNIGARTILYRRPDSMSCVSNKVSLLEQQSFPSCVSIIVSKVLRVFLEVIYDIYVICELTGNKRRIYSAGVDGEEFGAATVDCLGGISVFGFSL